MPRIPLILSLLLLGVERPLHAADGDELVRPPVATSDRTADAAAVGEAAPRAADVARALAGGDATTALRLAQALLTSPEPRVAAAAALVVGRLELERSAPGPALQALRLGRELGGPLAPWLAWHEAEALDQLGRADDALAACARYVASWPEGPHADACEELSAFALARAGRTAEALAAAAGWDGSHPTEPIAEQVELEVATWEARTDPAAAARRLARLATTFTLPGTATRASEALAALARQGVPGATLPTDAASLRTRAVSLREARRIDEAWSLFWSLAARPDPDTAAWVEAELPAFATATRRFDVLAAWWAEHAAQAPDDAGVAYDHFRAVERAGRYAEAFELGRAALARWPRRGEWVEARERIARDGMLARRYAEVLPILDALGTVRGSTGERNRFFAAFVAVLAGDVADARARLDRGIAEGSLVSGHRYWRAHLLDAVDPAAAAADRAWILEADPTSWYALLVRARACGPHDDGDGSRAARLPSPPPAAADPSRWPVRALGPIERLPTPRPFGELPPSRYHDAVDARATFDALVAAHGATFPALHAVQDLVDIGLYELSGPLFAHVVDDWRARLKRKDPDARAWARAFDAERMRLLYQHTRNHADLTRVAYGLATGLDATEQVAVAALSLPLAQGRGVWRAAEAHDVDPLLVLGLMRTESMYDPDAVSPVGARGPMQIMPRTGHLIAHGVGDATFHPGRLHEPEVAIDYGVRYLGMLLDRFDGGWPLAVAAYNGGPHNVSAWRAALGPDVPLDVFVEHIPWKETRRYVRSVSERYGEYLAIYAPGAHLHLPATPGGDDPSVVDF